jgi:CRISPR/Cas system-associated endoribonuclease Cas2
MKLERIRKSHYYHASLGKWTFYSQFRKQLSDATYNKLINYLRDGIRTDNYSTPILEHFTGLAYPESYRA